MLNPCEIIHLEVDELVKLIKEKEEFSIKLSKALNKIKVEELECLKKNNTLQKI
tara:strand:+ start:741 stop:902 length:162 start_codon:yes stop_codon:yes gene_type:complete